MNEKYEIEDVLTKANRNSIMIGSFKSDKGIYHMRGAEWVLMFDVKPLCEEPCVVNDNYNIFKADYYNNDKYIGKVKEQSNGKGLPSWFDANSYDYDQQKDELFSFYDDQLFIFQPYYKYEKSDDIYHKNLKILDVKSKPNWIKNDTFFKIIPKVNLDKRTFEKKLKKCEYFTLDSYPGDVYDNLDYICCDNYLYLSDSWEFNSSDVVNWRIANIEGDGFIKKVKIEDTSKMISSTSRLASNFVIIDESYTQELSENAEILVFEQDFVVSLEEKNIIEESKTSNDEFAMIDSFRKNVINSNLCYDYEDLINLHICAKSSSLTILAGMSGTGKTQLALQYAKMLDTQELNGTLLFMPITPSYTEPDDILGYLNPTNGLYTPAETGLVDFLVAAQKNTNKMYMVIFDEMNLSQIEYWFSPFISVLEKDVDTRYLSLYNDKSYCINKDAYPEKIKIGNNVVFIGTINLDETTKDISDRLLDRAFVINLNKKRFLDFYSQDLEKEDVVIPNLKSCDSSTLFNQWRSKLDPIKAFSKEELEFLDELHEIISKYDEQKGVSFRVLKNIGNYINNIPFDDENNRLIEKSHAFDLVLKQTVMKKISGPDNRLNEMIGTIKCIGDDPENSLIINLFDKYNNISDFSECKKVLKRKAEDLFAYGYTR